VKGGHPRPELVVDGAIVVFAVVAVFSGAAAQITLGVAVLFWIWHLKRSSPETRWPLAWALGAFAAVSLLSAATAVIPALGFVELRTSWIPVGCFYVCVNRAGSEERAARLVRILAASGAVSAVVGLSQTVVHGTEYRIHGTLTDWMTFSGLLLIVLMLAVAQLLFRGRGKKDAWLAGAVALMLVAVLASQTRSAWVGLAVALGLLIWIRDKRFLIALPLAAVLALAVAPGPVRERMLSFTDLEDITATERVFMWRSGTEIFLDYPLLGVGPGNVRPIYPQYQHPDDPWIPERRWTHLHSNIFQIAAERGLFGLLTWLAVWIMFLLKARRRWRSLAVEDRDGRARIAGAVAAILAFLAMGLFEYNFGDSEVIQLAALVMALPFIHASSTKCNQ
jgi:O-antigen ligase